jgi:hypothetical protein
MRPFFLFILFCFSTITASAITISTAVTPATCSSNGSIQVSVGGCASGSYIFKLTKNSNGSVTGPIFWNACTYTFNGLTPGSYTVEALFSGQSATQTVVVAGSYTSMVVGAHTVNNCCVTINVSGGKPPYHYAIAPAATCITGATPQQTSSTFCGLAAGLYCIRIYDNCNNFINSSVQISANPLILGNITCTPNGVSLYNLQVPVPLNGNSPYTYTWTNGSSTLINGNGNFTGLSGCNYDVNVTDNCGSQGGVQNVNSCVSSPTLSIDDLDCTAGSAQLSAIGGTAPYSFLEIHTNTTGIGGNFSTLPTNLASYLFKVTDACGRIDTLSLSLANCNGNVVYDCTPQCNFSSSINICYHNDINNAFPATLMLAGDTLLQVTDNSCVNFSNVPSGSNVLTVIDGFGNTMSQTVSCIVDTLAITGVYHYGCLGSILRFFILSWQIVLLVQTIALFKWIVQTIRSPIFQQGHK